MLCRATNTFDQRAIYLSVAGRVEFIETRPQAGVLNLGRQRAPRRSHARREERTDGGERVDGVIGI